MTTDKQKRAVIFCERILHNIIFRGDINDSIDVSKFLSEHLEDAKYLYLEMCCDYNALY